MGAWMIALAGAMWAIVSAQALDGRETILCGGVGVGFALAAVSLGPLGRSRRALLAGGLATAAATSLVWTYEAWARGSFLSEWAVFGLAVALAAAFALAGALRGSASRAGLRGAFALLALASAKLVYDDPSLTLYGSGLALALVGAILLAARPPAIAAT